MPTVVSPASDGRAFVMGTNTHTQKAPAFAKASARTPG
jgi:hypothetical protein